MIYRRRPTPLHAARASAACAYCASLVLVILLFESPIVLGGALVAVVGAGLLAQTGRALRSFAPFAISLALVVALINPFVVREGLTVIARLGEIPPLGQVDITLEATVYGVMLGLRTAALVLAFAVYSAAVDPDGVLRLFRRAGFRSALSATLATRLVPVLARDARRLSDAQQSRGQPRAGRRSHRSFRRARMASDRAASGMTLARAVTGGALDRAMDVAATLEVRGYGAARRPGRRREPWSAHDVAFAAAAAVLVALAIGAKLAGIGGFTAYPALELAAGPAEWALAALLALVAWLPFADRRGIAG